MSYLTWKSRYWYKSWQDEVRREILRERKSTMIRVERVIFKIIFLCYTSRLLSKNQSGDTDKPFPCLIRNKCSPQMWMKGWVVLVWCHTFFQRCHHGWLFCEKPIQNSYTIIFKHVFLYVYFTIGIKCMHPGCTINFVVHVFITPRMNKAWVQDLCDFITFK